MTEQLRCFACYAPVRVLDAPRIGPDGYARTIQALDATPRYTLDAATGKLTALDPDALALALADASLAVLAAEDEAERAMELPSVALLYEPEGWFENAKAKKAAAEQARAAWRAAGRALRDARAKEASR